MSSGNYSRRANEVRRRIGFLRQKIEQTEAKILRVHEGYESDPPAYTAKEAEERTRDFRALIARTEKEKQRLETIIEQQVTSQNTIEMVRRSLETVRDVNLDNASFSDRQELIAKLGIVVYPSEDHKTVRITSKLPVLGDKLSRYKISIASPKL